MVEQERKGCEHACDPPGPQDAGPDLPVRARWASVPTPEWDFIFNHKLMRFEETELYV